MVDGRALFFRPFPIAAVILMVANDRFFKVWYHNWWTGKLSDVAGVFFLPLFLLAVYSISTRRKAGLRSLLCAIVITDFVFLSIKFWKPFLSLYLALQAFIGLPAIVFPDFSDVIALGMNGVTWYYGRTLLGEKNRAGVPAVVETRPEPNVMIAAGVTIGGPARSEESRH